MLDRQTIKTFCEAVRKGCTYKAAAAAAGCNERTIYTWLHKGRKATHGKYKNFYQAVKAAEHQRQQLLLERIINASEKDWKAGAWLLERRDGFRKDAVWEEELPQEEVEELPSNPLELLRKQALDIQQAIAQAQQAQSWQAYAALQRQFVQVIETIRGIEAAEGSQDALQQASDDEIKAHTVAAIISLPPIMRQEIIEELSRFSNVVALKS
jgi:transposase